MADKMWLDIDGANNRAAIYSGEDDAPMADPYGNLARLKMHTAFKYIGFVPARTISTTVDVPASISGRVYNVTLGPHGQSGIPFVFGVVQLNGIWMPLKGSLPVFSQPNGNTQWWALTLDTVNVSISELRTRPSMQALSLPVIVYISDRIIIPD